MVILNSWSNDYTFSSAEAERRHDDLVEVQKNVTRKFIY